MTYSSDIEISRIVSGFIDRTLPRAEWTHAAHFAAALWLLAKSEFDAFGEMPGFIRRYNEATGTANTDSDGYHETITIASLRVAKYVLESSPVEVPLYETVNTLLKSEFGETNWLLSHWSRERLFSIEARREWLEPDLTELPFR